MSFKKIIFFQIFCILLFSNISFAGLTNITLLCENHGKKLVSLKTKIRLCKDRIGKNCPQEYEMEKKDVKEVANFIYEKKEALYDVQSVKWSYSAVSSTEAKPDVTCKMLSDITYSCDFDNAKENDGDVSIWIKGLCLNTSLCNDMKLCKEAGNKNCDKEQNIRKIKKGEQGTYIVTFKNLELPQSSLLFVQVGTECEKDCEHVFDFENTKPDSKKTCKTLYQSVAY